MSKHFKFFQFNSRKYNPVLDQEEGSTSDYKDSTGLSADQVPSLQVATSRKPNLLYISTFVFAALAIFLFAQNVQLRRRGSFHTGYKNELGMAILCSDPPIQLCKRLVTNDDFQRLPPPQF
jgi:hypothetical protein